ncbi:hypothetical protein EXU57_11765 [Segetibacter sp. 3557_3]|uniref:hypothetical protein n=1 Tax=Segetibacter sp. 3557_3 TaxID=2547429 RepID=UPI001058796F|nr:hypothetical protein [Segetibacter sp. 3557_3]TDH26161.1 hypothetical protein EXU57_11765 [Segetibacter sp. 3557_3]
MTIIYRIFGVILSIVAVMLALSIISAFWAILSSPLNMLSGFLMVSIVLYSWFSTRFHRQVLQRNKKVNSSLRDYIRVNGIVAMIFSIIIILEGLILMAKPELFTEAVSKMGVPIPKVDLGILFGIVAAYGLILLVHINWTFLLMKKYASFFR